jgi:hypothetical protein
MKTRSTKKNLLNFLQVISIQSDLFVFQIYFFTTDHETPRFLCSFDSSFLKTPCQIKLMLSKYVGVSHVNLSFITRVSIMNVVMGERDKSFLPYNINLIFRGHLPLVNLIYKISEEHLLWCNYNHIDSKDGIHLQKKKQIVNFFQKNVYCGLLLEIILNTGDFKMNRIAKISVFVMLLFSWFVCVHVCVCLCLSSKVNIICQRNVCEM